MCGLVDQERIPPTSSRECAPRAYLKPGPREVRAQMSGCVNEIGQPFGRQRRPAVDEHQMQTDPQTGETARAIACAAAAAATIRLATVRMP